MIKFIYKDSIRKLKYDMKKSLIRLALIISLFLVVPFSTISLNYYKNTVKAEDVKKATLKSLICSEAENNLNPEFNPNVTNYSLALTPNIIDLHFDYETELEGSNVEIIGNRYLKNSSGIIKIKVTHDDAIETTYTINYTKSLDGLSGFANNTFEFFYTGNYQSWIVPYTAKYRVELWGADGGKLASNDSYTAGYTAGDITLPKDKELFVYVGEQGSVSHNPTFNGGGAGGFGGSDSTNYGFSGGGATDIRLYQSDDSWSEIKSLSSRIMVAAGSGGMSGTTNHDNAGGHSVAGGLNGYNGGYYSGDNDLKQYGSGATQIFGGIGGINFKFDNDNDPDVGINESGSFGIGGSSNSTSSNKGSGGGGGGYFGGGAGASKQKNGYGAGGGGGSSFISGHKGSIAITGEENLTPKCNEENITDECSIHYSNYKFTNTKMVDGNSNIWNTAKTSSTFNVLENYNGNDREGYAKITLLSLPSDDNYLTSLTSTAGTFEETFNPTTETYNLILDAYTSKFSLNGVLSDSEASVTGLNEYTIALGETKKIQVNVVSTSGKLRTYIVNAERRNIDTNAHSSRLKEISIDSGNYTIDYEPLVSEYNVDISDNAMELPIEVTKFDEDAEVTITGNYYLKEPTGTITITVVSPEANPSQTTYKIIYHKTIPNVSISDKITTFDYTGQKQDFVVPSTGKYLVELWGASGRNSGNQGTPGLGAYTSGVINLTKDEVLYVYVGEVGNCTGSNYGSQTFNGGGYTHRCNAGDVGRGGGATDIRLYASSTGAWNDFESLKSRIMVAGAGGSANVAVHGGDAGGLTSYMGPGGGGGSAPATQISGYAFGSGGPGLSSQAYSGSGSGYFGGKSSTSSPCTISYGGSSYISGHNGCNSISSNSTSSSLSFTGKANHYSGRTFENTVMIDGKGYSWTNTVGTEIVGMPTTDGEGRENGHNGNGYAKITLVGASNDNYLSSLTSDIGTFDTEFSPIDFEYDLTLDKYESTFVLSATPSDEESIVTGLGKYEIDPGQTKTINITVISTSGKIRTYKVNVKRNNLNPGEHNSKLSKLSVENFNLNKTFSSLDTNYSIEFNSNIIDLKINYETYDSDAQVSISGNRYIKDDAGAIIITVTAPGVEPTIYRINYTRIGIEDTSFTYNYNGSYQEFEAPYGGTYQIQLWGAAGGDYDVNLLGGRGAYTSGKISLNKGEKFYIYVGSQPSSATTNTIGGYNGGGNTPTGKDKDGRAGGGATDIRLLPGAWNNIDSLTSRIMVAGAGGGAAYESSDTWRSNGGNGGGLSGFMPTIYGGSANAQRGTGGTQTAGGYANNSAGNTTAQGKFGQGGQGISTDGGSGGGAGYYGGGGSNVCSGGGGGSSFISGHTGCVAVIAQGDITPRDNSYDVTCTNGTNDPKCSLHYSGYVFSDTVMIGGNENMPNHNNTTTMTGNAGNGFAKITFLDYQDDDNYLTSLQSTSSFVEDFDKLVNEYHIIMDKYTRTLDISGTASSDKAKVTGFGKYALEPGTTKDVVISVISESGKLRTYTIHISREAWPTDEDTNLLKNLSVDKYDISPNFSSNQFNYTVNVYDSDIDLAINAVPFDSDAVATIEGNRYIFEDTGTITIKVSEPNVEGEVTYTINYTKISPTMAPFNVAFTGHYEEFEAPFSGKYKLETWGAAGGGTPVSLHTTNSSGGPGGYAEATFSIEKGTKLYVYAGQAGTSGAGLSTYGGPVGGWNGGGNGGNVGSGSGGGATDIRLTPGSTPTEWNNLDSLKSRIIVAGGGGGADDPGGTLGGSNDGSGGAGGNLTGQGAFYDGVEKSAYGGTQTNGAGFGYGGNVTANTDTGGGGGGYYGGTCTNYGNGGGGGGSSYIKNYNGADITYLDYQKDPNNPNNIKFINGSMQRGVNFGDGYARISLVELNNTDVYLNSLTSNKGEFEEVFDRFNGEYHLIIDKYTGFFTLDGEVSNDKSTVVGFGVQHAIDNGETLDIPITVTAESGDIKIYTVHATRQSFREGEHSARLKNLKIKEDTGYFLNEDFYSYNLDYTMNIYSNEIDAFIETLTYDPDAEVTITGDKYVKRGFGKIYINVSNPEARDGLDEGNKTSTTYTITYTKVITDEPSKNNYLKSLVPSVSTLVQADGTEEFKNTVHNYSLHLNGLQSGVRFDAEVDDSKANVDGDNIYYRVNPGESRVVVLTVTSAFGDSKTYTITITRDELPTEESTLLKSLVINGYEDDIEFDAAVEEYDITLPQGEIDLDIEALPLSQNANVVIDESRHLTENEGTIKITVSNNNCDPSTKVYKINYTKLDTSLNDFDYTGDYQTFIVPYTGKYTFELWGAQGGYGRTSTTYNGGLGAYTKGTIELTKGQRLYIYVGGKGADHAQNYNTIVDGGYNGGGAGGDDNAANSDTGGGGGGATDISLIPETIDYDSVNKVYRRSQKSYTSRIMVAAGGGGGAWNTVNPGQGSNAGGLVIAGYNIYHGTTAYGLSNGSQIAGYAFGYGESGTDNVNADAKGGAGGGYWTGVNSRYGGQGAGGTSYVSGHTGAIAVKAFNDVTPRLGTADAECTTGTTDNLCSIHYSGLKFENTQIIDGSGYEWRNTIGAQTTMPTHDGTGVMNGNSGNGYAKVTMEKDQDNYLQTLETDVGSFDIEFNPLSTNYILELNQYESYFTLTGTLSSNKAQVTGLGQLTEIKNGETKLINITVTAENGDIKVYKVHAHRAEYTDVHSTKLKSLYVYDYESSLNPKYNPGITDYEVGIDDGDVNINIDYVKYDEDANVEIKYNGRSENIIVGSESGFITIKVTYPGVEATTYKIRYFRLQPGERLYDFNYTGDFQVFKAPVGGRYKLQTWGAQGGYRQNSAYGGLGGYAEGIITLKKNEEVYVYVGASGNNGGYNGGGTRPSFPGGGGATDISIKSGEWDSNDHLYSRIIVAGGGGSDGAANRSGMYGGGETGGSSTQSYGSGGAGGTQSAAGGNNGSAFGKGGNGLETNGGYAGAGGGGWYGGGGSTPDGGSDDDRGGGGGSGFTYDGTKATPSGYSAGVEHKLTDTKLIAGNAQMPTYFENTSVMTGNPGNGHARITLLDSISKDNYLKTLSIRHDYGVFDKEFIPSEQNYTIDLDTYTPEIILDGETSSQKATVVGLGRYELEPGETKVVEIVVTAESGDIRTYRVTIKRAAYNDTHSSKLSRLKINDTLQLDLDPEFNSKVLDYNLQIFYNLADLNVETETYDPDATVTLSGVNHLQDDGYVKIYVSAPDVETTTYSIHYTRDKSLSGYVPTDKDVISEFNYTGNYQTFIAPKKGLYQFELWGAQGNYIDANRAIGGKGAYTRGILALEEEEKFYVYVGNNIIGRSASWNGGGSTFGGSSDTTNGGSTNGYGGGGATDVRTVSGAWNDATSLRSRIMVAGAGGGATNYSYPANGGAGGALTGLPGRNGKYPNLGVANIPPTGGSQTSGGTTTVANGADTWYGTAGSFGVGGNGNSSWGSAGGGGYYGGAGGGYSSNSVDSGAGGSSYISGYKGSVAVVSSSSNNPRLDSTGATCANGTNDITCSYHYSGYKFSEAVMLSGEEKMPTHDGLSTMTGNSGNGYARITQILLNEDNYLNSLESDYGTWNKPFDSLVYDYEIHLTQNDPTITLTAELSSKDATIVGDGYYELALGETKDIDIVVTSVSGATKTYKIKVSRDEWNGEHTSKLSYVVINNNYDEKIKLNETFNSNRTNYTFDLYKNYFNVKVIATPLDPEATYTVSNFEYLKKETDTVVVRVSAPGVADTVYNFTYTKTDYFDYESLAGGAGLDSDGGIDFDYTGKEQVFDVVKGGYYKLETWGAQGGSSSGGYGAYAVGYTFLKPHEKLYINVGGQGGTNAGGYNGGGGVCNAYAGGGATSIAKRSGILRNLSNYKQDVLIVSGAGGGYGMSYAGGHAGGIRGNNGAGQDIGYGGSQTAAGSSGVNGRGGGGFGYGGYGDWYCEPLGGGGAGWYGGSSGGGTNNNGSGGGGSSYIANPLLESLYSFTKHMTCYSCTTSNEADTLTYSVTNASNTPTEDYAKLGNGFARLSYVGRASDDNYLTDITSNVGELVQTVSRSEEIDPIVYDYDLTIDLYDEYFTIDAVKSEIEADIVGPGEYRLDPGESKDINLMVTSLSGNVRTYTVHATRGTLESGKHSTKLIDLDIVDLEDTFEPRYHSKIYEYDISIPGSIIDLSFIYEKYDENANVVVTSDNNQNKIIGDNVYYVKDDEGTFYITVTLPSNLVDENDNNTKPTVYVIHYEKTPGGASAFNYTGQYQTWTAPSNGTYLFELWGARGGTMESGWTGIGGKGAYTAGKLSLRAGEKFYIYVGNMGEGYNSSRSTFYGGWNGGGTTNGGASGGGGATDIRTVNTSSLTTWNEFNSLKSRIMIAAGGGGSNDNQNGGAGGGLTGYTGVAGSSTNGSGATQTAGGRGYNSGGFGYGGGSGETDGGSGGGGYFGGGKASGYSVAGGGGSSYISGHKGSNSIAETSTSSGITHTGSEDHYSGYVFFDTVMIDGAGYKWTDQKGEYVGMPTWDGTSTMEGNYNRGYAKISLKDQDNYLMSLSTNRGPLTINGEEVEFDKFTYNYFMELDSETTDITIEARPSSDNAKVDGLGKHQVEAGVNIYPIVVTAEAGDTRTYTLTVTRPASKTVTASSIEVTGFVEQICKGKEGFCQINPLEYNKEHLTYSGKVPAGIRDLEFTVTKDHYYQRIIGDGVTRLRGENNTISIIVKSEYCEINYPDETLPQECLDEGTARVYTYNIFRDMTGNNYLDQLDIVNPQTNIDFNYLLTEYNFRVENDIEELDLHIMPDDPRATFEIIGVDNTVTGNNIDGYDIHITGLEVGNNIIEIKVRAENGEYRSYVLNAYRLANGNTLLQNLQVFNGTEEFDLTPTFVDTTVNYTLSVPNEVKKVKIVGTPKVNTTSVSGDIGEKNLNTGLNQFKITSTAQNGNVEIYTIVITRAKSSNAYLSTLSALEGRFNENFVKTNNNYTITVEPHIKKLNINAVPEEEHASINITGNANFKIGNNTVNVIVTAEDGTKNTYKIIVNKEGSDVNTLKTLTVSDGELSPSFTPGHNEYRVVVPNNVTNITVGGTLTDTLSSVKGFGSYKLATGNNKISIVVTSETGIKNTYVINVFRELNDNANASSISVTSTDGNTTYEMNPSFTSDEDNYEVNVPSGVEEVKINATLAVPATSTITNDGVHFVNPGVNDIAVVITAEDGTIKTYNIRVIRDKELNANLKELVIKEARLNPAFTKMMVSYSAKVLYDVDKINLIATPEDPTSTVKVYDSLDNEISLNNISLEVGDNTIKVKVIPDDENGEYYSKTYTIRIKRLSEEESPELKLSDLTISNDTCHIAFDENTYYYECNVAYEVSQTTISATTKDSNDTVSGIGTFDLEKGNNFFDVVVSNQNIPDVERNYKVNIIRGLSKEDRLLMIKVDGEDLEDFDPETYEYNYITNEYSLDLEFIKYAGVNEDYVNQKIEITGNEKFKLGNDNQVKIKVTSEDGSKSKTYIINVTRTVRKNAYLTSLSIDEGELNPEFVKEITNYSATVDYEVSSLIISAVKEDPNATVTGDGMVSLDVGQNVFDVVVTAENGTTTRTYRITITRLGNPNNYLKSLVIDDQEYTPEFDKETLNYNLQVPYEVEKLNISAIPDAETATVLGAGEVLLKQGVNYINIYVTAENGSIRTYTIKVTRKDPITSKLLDIKIKNYEFEPTFDGDNTFVYSVTVDYETTSLDFIITKKDPYSTYEIAGNQNFVIGLNVVTIVVTSSNRIDQDVYTFIVNRQSYSNTFLSYLATNQGELNPVFEKGTMSYTVEVPYNTEDIIIDGSPDYPFSTVTGLGQYHVNIGDNLIRVVVTSPSGIKRTYNINVVRKKSSNANIISIESNIGTLTKVDDYNYKLIVPKHTTNVGAANFKVKVEDSMASVVMPATIDLKQTKVYPISVTSPDGTVTKEYDINVEFGLSNDATLAALIPDVGTLNPEFNRLKNNYTIDLFDDVDEEIFDLYLNEVNATLLNRTLTFNLPDYENTAEIMVQAEDGTINIYTVNMIKSKTKQKELDNVLVRHGEDILETDPIYRPNEYSYDLDDVDYEVSSLSFDILKKHRKQNVKVYVNNNLYIENNNDERFIADAALNVGDNTIKLEVINTLGEKKTYTYHVKRKLSTNANLENIIIKNKEKSKTYELIPTFDKDELEYYVQIPYDATEVDVTATSEDPTSKITPGAVTISGATYLSEGENDITITSRAPAGNKKIYKVHILRTPAINNLIKNITISSGDIYQLTPKFRPGFNGDYNLTVSSAIRTIHIDAIPDDQNTTIKVKNTEIESEAGQTLSADFDLSVGENVFEFVSTNEDTPRTYKLIINRLSDNNALLSNIIVNNGTLVEDFSPTKLDYNVNVDFDVTSLDLEVIPEDRNAKVEILNNENLAYGETNQVKIRVTSANNAVISTYTLDVHVKGESNNYLSDISIDSQTIQGFDKYKQTYDLIVDYGVDSIDLEAVTESNKATITSALGNQNLSVGLNTFDIVVKAQDDSERVYTINITREENAYLSNIVYTIKGEEDEEAKSYYVTPFDRDTYEYEIEVENDITKINVIALADDLINAQIVGNGEYDLQVGTNPITITVRNKSSKKIYTLNVKRKGSSNTNLNYLTSTDADITPEFTNDNNEYEIHVPNYKTKLALSYEPEHHGTRISVENDLTNILEDNTSNVVLTVTAEDGTIRTITIKVYLEDASYFSSRLASLKTLEGSLSPKFDPDTLEYSVTVNQNVENLNISAIPESKNAVVVGNGEQPLELGKNVIPIVVTAEDGSTTTYEIIAFRKDMSNADLTGLYTDTGELDPEFDPKVNTYTIVVPAETEKIHLTAVAYAEKTIVGDGDVYLHKGVTVRNIVVTSEDGTTNTYVVNIDRILSENPTITNITTNRTGMTPATFDKDTLEYNITVPDSVSDISFNITTESKLAVPYIAGNALDNDTDKYVTTGKYDLEYGDNEIIVYALAEDGIHKSQEYKFIVHRIHDLHRIYFDDYETCGNVDPQDPRTIGDNKCDYKISVQPGGTFNLEPKFDPADADFTEVTYQVSSGDGVWISVDQDGLITSQDVLDKYSYVKVTSKTYPNVSTTIKVMVEITLISSEVYNIYRDVPNYNNYVTRVELKTTAQQFVDNLDNDNRFLHIYDLKNEEVTDYSKYVGTGMQVRLENNGHTYDTLDIIVIGDIDGDGKCMSADYRSVNRHILKQITLTGDQFLAADNDENTKIQSADYRKMNRYILKQLDSLLP